MSEYRLEMSGVVNVVHKDSVFHGVAAYVDIFADAALRDRLNMKSF